MSIVRIALPILLLCLILQIRLGVRIEYSGDGFFLWITVLRFKLQVLPQKKIRARKRRAKKADQPPRKQEKQSASVGGSLETVQRLLPVALDALKYLRRKIKAETLRMNLTAAADDPADAALRYAQATALLSTLWLPMTHALSVVDGKAHIDVDFQASKPAIYLLAQVSLTLGQALTLAVVYGFRALTAILSARRNTLDTKQRKAEE